MPIIKEGMLVTDELCAQYQVLEREIQILQGENLRLRRMLEYFINPRVIPPPPKE
jgi:prefoldin subunit 5